MEKEQRKSQQNKILDCLRTDKYLTSFEAYTKLGVTQFATRIKELEKKGYCFKKEWDYAINQKGEKKRFKIYSLEEADEQ